MFGIYYIFPTFFLLFFFFFFSCTLDIILVLLGFLEWVKYAGNVTVGDIGVVDFLRFFRIFRVIRALRVSFVVLRDLS